MSIIAVHGFPPKYNLKNVVSMLARAINGNFEALNFITPKGQGNINKNKLLRTCFIRLSAKLDPLCVVERINRYKFRTKLQYKAHIPKEVPDIPLSVKPKFLPQRLRSLLGIPEELTQKQVLQFSTEEILLELQVKFPGLYSLSKRYEHKLLQELSKKVYTRVQQIVDKSKDIDTCTKLTSAYRNDYPHSEDFQLVLDTHHAVQDAAGAPRGQLLESEISFLAPPPLALDVSASKLKELRNKCADKILTKLTDHIRGLDSDIKPTDNENQIARKQVRLELKKLSPFLQTIVNQMMDKHFMPQDGPIYRMRIYGEPCLPNLNVMKTFLVKFKVYKMTKSHRMYNLLMFGLSPAYYHSLMAMNGTVLDGAKLVIRTSNMVEYKGVRNALCVVNPEDDDGVDQEPMDEDDEDEIEDEDDDEWDDEQEMEL